MLIIPIKAVGKQRPRLNRWGNVYTPAKTKDFENTIAAYASVYMNDVGLQITDGPVCIGLVVKDKVPTRFNKDERERALNGEIRPIKTPDGDNILKAILDGMNKIVYEDDKQVVQFYFNRHYSESNSIEIDIKHL